MISGIPTTYTLNSTITVTLSNPIGDSSSFSITFTVLEIPSFIKYPKTDYIFITGIPVNTTTTTHLYNGDNIEFSLISGTLPDGFYIDSHSGVIGGTNDTTYPTTTLVIQSSNILGKANVTLSITLIPPAVNYQSQWILFLVIAIVLFIIVVAIVFIVYKTKHSNQMKTTPGNTIDLGSVNIEISNITTPAETSKSVSV